MTYMEVAIAAAIMSIALVPAMEALQNGMLGARVFQTSSDEHYSVLARMEEVLAEPYGSLAMAAAVAGSEKVPSSYSDAAGPPDRRLVFIALYDADDADGDGDVFSVPDPNFDGDNDPYTGFTGLLWVHVEVEGSVTSLESLVAP
ncbi:MAG: hypothetical protein KJO95_08370 [Gammaproteobacteria bacterium]|nr:hypothetical protein [Gammaproteobacteria bacterium]